MSQGGEGKQFQGGKRLPRDNLPTPLFKEFPVYTEVRVQTNKTYTDPVCVCVRRRVSELSPRRDQSVPES